MKVLGHRGVRKNRKVDENALPAFTLALESCDGIETDAAVSKDGTPWLIHEISQVTIPHLFSRARYAMKEHLDKISAKRIGKKHLGDMTDDDIAALRLKKGGAMPRLSELFALAAKHPGCILNIELKGDASVGPVIDGIQAAVKAGHIKKEQVILTSFDHQSIRTVRRLDPAIKCGFIFARYSKGRTRIYPWSDDNQSRYAAFTKKAIDGKDARDVKPDYFVMTPGALNPKLLARMKKNFPDAQAMIWTVRKPAKDKTLARKLANPAIAQHIAAVISDYPADMVSYLKKKGFRP
jgi:glycerophosphoryl diester phosphodiesterase